MIQQQRGAIGSVQGYPAHIVHRLAGPRNPLDPYDHLVQQRQQLGFAQGKFHCIMLVCDAVTCSAELLPGVWRPTEEPAIYKGTVFLHR
jgi:hypothetical protein